MTLCAFCESPLPDSATECPNCGAVVASNSPASLRLVCPACGAINSSQAKFCDQCGIRIVPNDGDKKHLSRSDDVRSVSKAVNPSQSTPSIRQFIESWPLWSWVVVGAAIMFLVCTGCLLLFTVVYGILMTNGVN